MQFQTSLPLWHSDEEQMVSSNGAQESKTAAARLKARTPCSLLKPEKVSKLLEGGKKCRDAVSVDREAIYAFERVLR